MPRRTPLFFESNLRRALVVLSTKILLLLLLLLEEEEAFTDDDDDDDDARENDDIKAHDDIAKKKSVPPKRALSPAGAGLVSSLASPKRVVLFVVCTKGSRDNFVSNSNELFDKKEIPKTLNPKKEFSKAQFVC